MKLFEGKTPAERNKIIAALVLGTLSLFSLFMAFGPNVFGGKTTVTVTATPTPKPAASPADPDQFTLPTAAEQNFGYETTPVLYRPGLAGAPDAGRNIFAFYEPPPPTPYSPTPYVEPPVKTPTPTPTPPILVNFVAPQSVYAGSKSFRLEVTGDKFGPETRIYFNQSEMPTTFVNPQRLIADIPANLVDSEGPRQIIVQSTDGRLYSNPVMLTVQPQPKPDFQYIGLIAKKRHNNDTAYFKQKDKPEPFSGRLNDVLGGRFRLVSISAEETVFEDVNLGFRHRLALERPVPTADSGIGRPDRPGRSGFPREGNYIPYNPNMPQVNIPQQGVPQGQPQQDIPGIPNNIPRYIPPNQNPPQQQQPPTPDKKDEDGDDTDG